MTRFFRASLAVYQSICDGLDAAYGYPNESTKTARSLPDASTLYADNQGRVYLAVSPEECQYVLPSEMLAALLADGSVEEITAAEYAAVLPQSPVVYGG